MGGSSKGNKTRSGNDNTHIIEDEEYVLYDRPGRERNGRSFLGKKKDDDKNAKEKRARSEERNKNTRDYSLSLSSNSMTLPKDGKKDKGKVEEVAKKANGNATGEVKQGKKQHKIRRKLLMGGLIRRKNRSMPDLREGQEGGESGGRVDGNIDSKTGSLKSSQDDSSVGLRGADKSVTTGTLSGYLSEGHLEYTGNGNPNLERSKLMRKSFHGSAGKVLHVPKVPPPPPLRTTSQLTAKSDTVPRENVADRPQFPLPTESTNFHNMYPHFHRPGHTIEAHRLPHNPPTPYNYNFEPQSLPYLPTYSADMKPAQAINESLYQQRIQGDVVMYANGGILCDNRNQFPHANQLVTQAEVHHEHNSSVKVHTCDQNNLEATDNLQQSFENQQQECLPVNTSQPATETNNISPAILPLPPYPSPLNSVSHSRQASEDFPPPPPPLDTAVATEAVNKLIGLISEESYVTNHFSSTQLQTVPSSLLMQLQQKRQQILAKEASVETETNTATKSGEEWLRELQAKQAERKLKKLQSSMADTANKSGDDITNACNGTSVDKKPSSVKDLASRFENIRLHTNVKNQVPNTSVDSEIRHAKTVTSSALKSSTSTVPVKNSVNGRVSPFPPQDRTMLTPQIVQPSVNLNSSFDSSTNFLTTCPPNLRENRSDNIFDTGVLSVKKRNSSSGSSVECLLSVGGNSAADDIQEFPVNGETRSDVTGSSTTETKETRKKNGKKKNVTFCDQVILVATAEDEEEDNYIPNPILERVLRSAFHGKQDNHQQSHEPHIEVRSLQGSESSPEPPRSVLNVKDNNSPQQQQPPYQKVPLQQHFSTQYNLGYQHTAQQTPQQQHDLRSPYKPIHPDMLRSSQMYHHPPSNEQMRIHPPYQHVPVPQQMYNHTQDHMRGSNQPYLPPAHPSMLQQSLYHHQQRTIPAHIQQQAHQYPEQQHQVNNIPTPSYNDIIQIPPEYQHPPQPHQQSGLPYYHHQQQQQPFVNSSHHSLPGLSNGHNFQYQQRQMMPVSNQQSAAGHPNEQSYIQQSQQTAPPYQHPPVRQTAAVAKVMTTMPSASKDAGKRVEKKLAPVIDMACHLCRKKQVTPPAIYCSDCDFYMSRFRPRT